MIDIVESASPETLETAATALVDARDAIKEAADELSRNLGAVDWEGEAHTAFYKWGMDLTTTAQALATYADEVGTQVLAAGSGLASVRKSMPPRDTRLVRKTVDDIPTPAQVDTNKDYAAAVKAEKDRQEAINQMYRLASFYTVSSGMMQLAEEPVFPKMPDVGVPPPPPGWGKIKDPANQTALSDAGDSAATRQHSVANGTDRPSAVDLPTSPKRGDEAVVLPDRHVGTEIDSVGTLPHQDTMKPTTVTPPSTAGPSGSPVGTVPPCPWCGASHLPRAVRAHLRVRRHANQQASYLGSGPSRWRAGRHSGRAYGNRDRSHRTDRTRIRARPGRWPWLRFRGPGGPCLHAWAGRWSWRRSYGARCGRRGTESRRAACRSLWECAPEPGYRYGSYPPHTSGRWAHGCRTYRRWRRGWEACHRGCAGYQRFQIAARHGCRRRGGPYLACYRREAWPAWGDRNTRFDNGQGRGAGGSPSCRQLP